MFQDVYINSANLASGTIDLTNTLSSSPSPQLLYIVITTFEIKSGATLTVSSDANVQINNGASITVDAGAAMTVGAASMVAQDTNNNYAEGITVDGTLTATGTAFTKTGGGVTAYIQVNPAGHLVATGTNFSWDSLALAGGSVLTNGDLDGDSFNLPIYVPITDIPLLAGNVVFQDVYINSANLASGTIDLTNNLSSSPSPQLLYIVITTFEIKSGATLTVSSDASLQINNGASITVDAGAAMNVGAASMVAQDTNNNYAEGITVDGTLTATGTAFTKTGGGVTAYIQVNPAGHLVATGTNFSWDSLSLAGGSVSDQRRPGRRLLQLAHLRAHHRHPAPGRQRRVPGRLHQLGQPRQRDHRSDQYSLVLAVAPAPLHRHNHLRDQVGGRVDGVQRRQPADQQWARRSPSMRAAMTVGAASMVAQDTNNNYAEGITVDGTLTATGTAFTKTGGGVTAYIQVNPAGHLVATGTNFSWDSLALAGGSVLTNGDLAGDSFNLPIYVPITDIPLLAGNVVFQDVYINSANLASGTIDLTNTLSSSPSPQLLYIVITTFEIKSGATLTVSSDASLQINNGASITVDAGAAMNVGAASMVAQDTNNNYAEGISVDGTLVASGTTFTKSGGGVTAYIQVNTGGGITANNTTFGWDSLTLNAGTNGQLAADTLQHSARNQQRHNRQRHREQLRQRDRHGFGRFHRYDQPDRQLLGHDEHDAVIKAKITDHTSTPTCRRSI